MSKAGVTATRAFFLVSIDPIFLFGIGKYWRGYRYLK